MVCGPLSTNKPFFKNKYGDFIMSRTKGILAAGTLTGLVLITILALGFGSLQAQSSRNMPFVPATEVGIPPTNSLANEETLQAWQDYSAQLEQTVRVLQERDIAYQQQLEASNQTILQLQDQMNSGRSTFGEHEEHEREEHEHEEHEHEEHEGFEFGEFDD
jgi:hypothetical protein